MFKLLTCTKVIQFYHKKAVLKKETIMPNVIYCSSVLNEGKNGGGFIQQGMLYLIRQN